MNKIWSCLIFIKLYYLWDNTPIISKKNWIKLAWKIHNIIYRIFNLEIGHHLVDLLPKTSEEKKVPENEGMKSINSIYFILNCSEDVRGVDVTQDLNLHPINTVPEYCRLWPALPNACEELMKISNDYSQEWIFSHVQEKTFTKTLSVAILFLSQMRERQLKKLKWNPGKYCT